MHAYSSYVIAGKSFEVGTIDAMFAGSAIAASMIREKLARPVVRPVSQHGGSMYSGLLVARAGTPEFKGDPAAIRDKRLACSKLTTAGEFLIRSLVGRGCGRFSVSTHSRALDLVALGEADVAAVKDRVWELVKEKYPTLEVIGRDEGRHPNATLIASRKASPEVIEKISRALLQLEDDPSSEARQVKQTMEITGFIVTAEDDFQDTFSLLDKAASGDTD
jgi:ABC-type phosphate/phosphonate transport system substrate-binding protein